MEEFILYLSCPDKRGIVAAVSACLAENRRFVVDAQQFGDQSTGRFFMRWHFISEEGATSKEGFSGAFQRVADQFDMTWNMKPKGEKTRVLLMASKVGHTLNALLNKMHMGDLAIEVPAIVSNHPDLQEMASWYDVPFYHLPITPETKREQEAKVLELIKEHNIDLVVLARYMQILSGEFVNKMKGKIINIHHSFLPSFKGARPYHQAFNRGVKIIGATAHYVSEELDEGPIIEQEVTRIEHDCPVEELIQIGQDIECLALAKAVKWHTEHRVFLNGIKTVVFR